MKNARQSAGRCGRREIELAQRFYRTAAPVSIDPLTRLLDRLESVKETGPGCWIARCPAHDDKRPSLSIKENADGALLVHCFAGCDTAAVVAAVGLTLADLFPTRDHHHGPPKSNFERKRYGQALDALKALARESLIVLVAAENLATGRTLTSKDLERLRLAESRIQAARAVAA